MRLPQIRNDNDLGAVLWGIACCWLAVWGNVLLLHLGVTIFYVVPFDVLMIPALVTALFWMLFGRR